MVEDSYLWSLTESIRAEAGRLSRRRREPRARTRADDRNADARRRCGATPAALHRDRRLLRLDEGREDPGSELRAQVHAAAPSRLGTRPAAGPAANQDPGIRDSTALVRGGSYAGRAAQRALAEPGMRADGPHEHGPGFPRCRRGTLARPAGAAGAPARDPAGHRRAADRSPRRFRIWACGPARDRG